MIGSITQRVMLLGLAFFGGGSWIQRPMRTPLGADFVETAGTIMQMKPHQSAAKAFSHKPVSMGLKAHAPSV
jgi:hypothetical protein